MNNITDLSKEYNYFYYFCGFTLFFALPVYFRWNNSQFNILVYFYIWLLFYYLFKGKVEKESLVLAAAFSLLFVWERFTYNVNIVALSLNLLLPFSILIPIGERTKIMDCFILKIFPVLLGVSVIAYILWMFAGLNLPTSHLAALNDLKDYDYITHVFFVTPTGIDSLRFHSYYDEPGVVGTFSAIILFFYNKKLPLWAWMIYLVAGFLSFSFFFYGIMILYPLALGNAKLSKRTWRIIIGVIMVLIVFSFFERSIIDDYVFNRFEIVDSGFAGDNRNNQYFRDFFYNTFIHSGELLFGSSNLSSGKSFTGGSFSIEVMIYRYGLIFVIYGTILYLYLLWKYRISDKQFFITTLIWLLLTYQRPSFTSIFYYIFFTTVLQSNALLKQKRSLNEPKKDFEGQQLSYSTP